MRPLAEWAGPQSQEASVPQSSEGVHPRGDMDWLASLCPPENVSLRCDVHRDQPLCKLREARAAHHWLAVFWQHGRSRRWGTSTLQGPPPKKVPRTGPKILPLLWSLSGGENGFNIPHVKPCPEVGRYLSLTEDELSRVDTASLREPVRRLLCDSYMCLYHSPELSLYKWWRCIDKEPYLVLLLYFLETNTVVGQMNLDEMANILYVLLLFFLQITNMNSSEQKHPPAVWSSSTYWPWNDWAVFRHHRSTYTTDK